MVEAATAEQAREVAERLADVVARHSRLSFAPDGPGIVAAMCGIVGYVGERTALASSSTGCGGWSTGATTPPASPSSREGAARRAQEGRQAGQPREGARRATPLAGVDHRASGTPGGPPTAGRPTATPTRTVDERPGRRHPQRHHRELRRAARPSSRRAGVELRSDTDTEVAAHLLEARARRDGRGGDLAEAMRRVCRRLEGAFTLLAVDARHTRTSSSAPGATRRSSSAAATGENFLASDVSAFIEHTREAVELGQDQVVELRRDERRDHRLRRRTRPPARTSTSTGTPRPPRRAATTTSCSRRSPSSRSAVADTLRGRIGDDGLLHARRDAADRPGPARRRQGLHRRLRHGLPRGPGRQVRHRALDPAPVRGRAGQRVPLPRPGARPVHAGRRDLAVRRDHGHADGAAPRAGAEGAGARDLQHQRLDDPARVRRRALHPRRARRSRSPRPRRS